MDNEGNSPDDDSNESMDSDEASDEDDSTEQRVNELNSQITDNPYMYNGHVELIDKLRQMGELERLRNARENMNKYFPLTPELWLDWLRDEIPLVTEDATDRRKVEQLFERAVKDYLSVEVWLEYVQYSIGGMGQKDGIVKVREVFERALSAAGIHVTQGAQLWEAYREFENAVLAGLMPAPGQVATEMQEKDFKVQHNKVIAIFKRQLSVPLYDIEETFSEFKEFIQDEIDSYTKQVYEKAKVKLEKLKPYEDALESAESPKLEQYQEYIKYELSQDEPARIQCIFERAVRENCLNSDLWIQYAKYLDTKLRTKLVILAFYERAISNCPWCPQLWQRYLLALERWQEPHDKIKGTVDRALGCGFSNGSDYLLVWTAYCDYLRRRIKWQEGHEDALELFRMTIEKAVEHISEFGVEGDPTGSLRQFWAVIEGKFCKNMTRAREIWNEIMSEGHGSEASAWLEYYKLERAHGDNKHCRKLLQRALNSVTDWPESIVEIYLNFEREEGDLEQYDNAVAKCDAQMERINERRAKTAEKEAVAHEQKKENRKAQKRQKQFDKSQQRQPSKSQHKQQEEDQSQAKTQSQDRKRSHSGDTTEEPRKKGSFKVPPPPGSKSAPPPGYKGSNSVEPDHPAGGEGFKVPPPPGFKGQVPVYKRGRPTSQDDESEFNKKMKTEDVTEKQGQGDVEMQGHDDKAEQNPDKAARTAFVSNLDFSIEEDRIGQIFAKCGELTDIRLVRTFKGKSKGYAYVEFKDELSALEALKLDRTSVEGRPMYVSKCEDKAKTKTEFKFSTNMEKNKLFIRNLPFTCSKDALEQIFSQHGRLKEVRLVTYRSGAPKGLAYVEYVDEHDAAKAVVHTDGLKIGDHEISVAISNPPERKTPMSKRDETSFQPSLGGGKKETEIRGKARTQVSLVPRSVKRTPATGPPPSSVTNQKTVDKSASNGQSVSKPESKMSNEDFRKMLLKK